MPINWLLHTQPQMAFQSASINFPFRGINLINFPFSLSPATSYRMNDERFGRMHARPLHPLGWVSRPTTLFYTRLPIEHVEKEKLSLFFNYHKMPRIIK